MEQAERWWFPADSAYSISNIGATFNPHNVSAYFRRLPQSRVTKLSSRNSSPRTQSKRRMTTQIPARTKSVIEHQRSSGVCQQQNRTNRSMERPVSWHPNAFVAQNQYSLFGYDTYHPGSLMSSNTNYAHGLITPDTSAIGDEQHADCPDLFLDRSNVQDLSFAAQCGYTDPQGFICNQDNGLGYIDDFATSFDANVTMFNSNPWPVPPQQMPTSLNTAPSSPQLLPFPDMGPPLELIEPSHERDGEELVGMGLYDSPAEVQSSALFLTNALPVRRKSLKLEESFEPAPVSPGSEQSPDTEELYSEPDVGAFPVSSAEIRLRYNDDDGIDKPTSRVIYDQPATHHPQFTVSDVPLRGNHNVFPAGVMGGNFTNWF